MQNSTLDEVRTNLTPQLKDKVKDEKTVVLFGVDIAYTTTGGTQRHDRRQVVSSLKMLNKVDFVTQLIGEVSYYNVKSIDYLGGATVIKGE